MSIKVTKIIGTKTKSTYKVSPIIEIDMTSIPETESVDSYLSSIECQQAINEAFRESLLLGKLKVEWYSNKK